jgi:exopolysaccharide production protein ExoZ
MTIETPTKPYFESLQILRGIAALSVVILHVLHEVNVTALKMTVTVPSWVETQFPFWVGVHIFFVLSGFLMVYTSQKLFETPGGWRIFLKKRFQRIVPLYWFYTTAMVAVILILPSALDTAVLDIRHVIQSYLFIPHDRPSGGVKPILALGWTLNYEMFFYVIFASFLFLSRAKLSILISCLFVGLAAPYIYIPSDWIMMKFWSNPIILEFIAGMIIANLYINKFRLPSWALPIGLILCLSIFLCMPFEIMGVPYVPSFLIAIISVAVLVLRKKEDAIKIPRYAKMLGDSSYTLYLSHPFFIGAVALIAIQLDLSPLMHIALSLSACVVGGYIAHIVIEKPMIRYFKRKNG